MEKSRHYKKATSLPDHSMIGKRQPPTIKFNPLPPPTMENLALKFALSCNSYYQYVEELERERYGLNLVSVPFTDPYTGEKYNQIITERDLDARMALGEFYECMEEDSTNETSLRTYDQLLVDSDEESVYSDEEDDGWKIA